MIRLNGRAEYLYFYHIATERPQYNIVIYSTIEDIVEEINSDNSDEKWIVFQSNKEQANKNLVKKVTKSCVSLSADNKGDEAMKEIVENYYFSADILVTTKVLDNGISLHDSLIKKIVLDTISETEFLQMIGRRRRCESDNAPLTLYIPKKSVKYFTYLLNEQIVPELEIVQTIPETLLEKMMQSEDIYRTCRKYFDIRENKLVLNPIAKDNLEGRKRFCERILTALKKDEYAFVKEQLSWIGQELDRDYLSCSENGLPHATSSFNMALTKLCRRAGLPHLTVHSLRHMYASILTEQGVPLIKVSALLGHSSLNTTFEYYCEVMDETEKIRGFLNNSFLPEGA